MRKCTSCNKSITNDSKSASFPCPNCSKVEIARCSKCRRMGINYICEKCEFEGP